MNVLVSFILLSQQLMKRKDVKNVISQIMVLEAGESGARLLVSAQCMMGMTMLHPEV